MQCSNATHTLGAAPPFETPPTVKHKTLFPLFTLCGIGPEVAPRWSGNETDPKTLNPKP
jgi:hypothetical protein